jgi:nucleotide-binding universal stress UspA family protein
MQTLTRNAAASELGVRATRTSPIIVATDGEDQSNSAMIVGRLLATAPEALRLASVVKPLPIVSVDAPIAAPEGVEASRRVNRWLNIEAQSIRVWGGHLADVDVCEGDPAATLARVARETNATMIVSGLGRHRVVDRLFGDETALRLVRASSVPVFAVASGTSRLPARIVVAVDFSETSLRAARLALEVAAPRATIYLAHVGPRDSMLREWNGSATTYKDQVRLALSKMRKQLRVPLGTSVESVMLQGDPAIELLAFASTVGADAIATGSHGHGFVTRMIVGSVTTRILRCATCSVLCVPYAAAMTHVPMDAAPAMLRAPHRLTWFKPFGRHASGTLERP